ncbi:hypothetical protein M5K25_008476 [Dendrobium thyrsiflorum]|uniref:Protein NBR1 homolog n=1 Tax=Dendrobium thyrsiflorum TaxID=117978 RepID=A0ABD0V9D7_DENTH
MSSTNSFLSRSDKEQGGDDGDVVIKVKYGDTLRRFSIYVHQQTIEYDMNMLRTKISSLFKFSNDAVLVLTYKDEDGDVVALDNDDELRDAVLSQRLNPLRITVQLKTNSTDGSYSRPNAVRHGNNSEMRSDEASPSHNRFPRLAAELNSTVEKSLKPFPDPIRGVLTNLSRDVIQTASTAPILNELLLLLSKMQLTNDTQSSQEPFGKPLNAPCGSPSRVADLNTCDEPKASNDLQNQLPRVLPQTNIVSPIHDNIQKMHEVGLSSQCLESINYAPLGFYPNMSKEQKDNCKGHHDGKSELAAEPPMPFDTQGGHATLGSSDKPKPFVASMFSHGNTSSDRWPSDVASQFPFGFTSQGDALGNRHAVSTAIPCANTRPSDVNNRCPFNTMFSFPPKVDSSCKGNAFWDIHAASSFSCLSSMPHSYRRSSSCHDNTSRTFHRGVICDGCGMHPIMGPRYKSNVKEDYDLCGTCFQDMGKEAEYTRIDGSAFRFPKPKKEHHKHKHRNRLFSAIESHSRVKVTKPKLWSCFIRDVTVWDGTLMRPSSRFTKIWRMRNNGAIAWPSGTQLVCIRGYHLGGQDSAELEIPERGFPVDEELDVAVDLVAPSVLGRYISYWQMLSPSGQKFGEEVWVIIQVDDQPSAASSSAAAPTFLNLNLPPEISHQSDEMIVHAEPLDCMPAVSDESKLLEELLKPLDADMLNSAQQDGNSYLQPSSDSLDSSFMVSPAALIEVPISSSPLSYPAIDVQESPPLVMNPADPDRLNSIQHDVTAAPPQPSSDTLASVFIVSSPSLIDVPTSSSPVSYPAINVEEPLPPVSYPLIDIYSSNPPDTNQLPSDVLTEENTVEQTLLRELEEMGFKQIDLNKEILRQNHYDLEQAVGDLCGFDEWDPLLEDLHEMGFNDRELNRKLLLKNGGSIKRVVMELVTGEKSK